MSRRCSHCGHNGHNSRTCLDKGVKLFGVLLSDPSASPSSSSAMRKSISLGNLTSYGSSEAACCPLEQADLGASLDGYVSDDLVHTTSNSRERKKGVPWTEEEHRLFLIGLQKLGKGDWRGISRDFVKTRTPTQVASHAQKYFLRRSHLNKRRRRSSLFDITPDTVSTKGDSALEESALEGTDVCPLIHQLTLGQNMSFSKGESVEPSGLTRFGICGGGFPVPLASLSLSCVTTRVAGILEEGGEEGDTTESGFCEMMEAADEPPLGSSTDFPEVPSSVAGKINSDSGLISNNSSHPCPLFPFWSAPTKQMSEQTVESKIVKPTPIFPTSTVKIDDSRKISELSLAITRPVMEPSPLSFKLLEERSRHSAFHTMSSVSSNKLDAKGSLGSAISVA